MIMLVTSATESSTSSLTEPYSVCNRCEAIVHATSAEHDTLPEPTQEPASPTMETTPEAAMASSFSTKTSPVQSSRLSMVEKTSEAEDRIASTSSDCVSSCSIFVFVVIVYPR